MTSNFCPATGALLALAFLAPLPSFAIGRDLTPLRMATPDYLLQSSEPYGAAFAATVNTNGTAAVSPPAAAANSAGDTAIVTTEFSMVWLIDRARLYFASEFPLPRRRATF